MRMVEFQDPILNCLTLLGPAAAKRQPSGAGSQRETNLKSTVHCMIHFYLHAYLERTDLESFLEKTRYCNFVSSNSAQTS